MYHLSQAGVTILPAAPGFYHRPEKIDDLVKFAIDVVHHCGEKALSFYGKGQKDVKFDEGLVTEAELQLREFFP